MTMSAGLYSSFRLPTALAERMNSTPSVFMPNTLARKFSSDGDTRWPPPCLARNATRLPRSVPSRYGPDGSPNGVVTFTSSRSVTPAISYRPEPPMMPMCARCISVLACRDPGSGSESGNVRLGSWEFEIGSLLNQLLHRPFPVFLADVASGHGRIVAEEDQVFPVDCLAQEALLEGE